MISQCCYLLSDIFHIIKVFIFIDVFLALEKRTMKFIRNRNIAVISLIWLTSSIIFVLKNEIIDVIVYFLSMLILMMLIYKEKLLKVILPVSWSTLILNVWDLISLSLVGTTMKMLNWSNTNIRDIIASGISLCIVYIIAKLYKKNYGISIKSLGQINLLFLTVLSLLDLFIVTALYRFVVDNDNLKNQVLRCILLIGVIIGIFIQLGAVILLFAQKTLYKEKGEITEKYLNEQKNHYEYLENREKETKKFRHDLRSHMQMLSDLIKSREYDKVDDYMEKIHIKIDNIGNIVTVNNGMVDAIVNQYYIKAMECGVNMRVGGRFPSDCDIDAYNLCIIFSNILSNAVEAAVKSEEKKIDFECRYNKDKIVVVVKNSFKNIGQFDNGKMETQKEDINYHGFGLENIKESVEKYNGMVDIDILNNEFKLMIMLHYMETRKDEDSNS